MMNVHANPPIIVAKAISTPSLFGILKPCILLPYNMLEKLNDSDLKYIFLHELAHMNRKDNLISWMA